MHSDFDHWVGAAVDCFEDDGSLKSGNITKFDELLQLIVEEWNISNEEFHASNEVITRKVRSVLQDARDESDPVRYVHQSKGRIQKELGTKSLATYTITFPLNLTLSNWNNPPRNSQFKGSLSEKLLQASGNEDTGLRSLVDTKSPSFSKSLQMNSPH